MPAPDFTKWIVLIVIALLGRWGHCRLYSTQVWIREVEEPYSQSG
jgi:hypothetical protein